MPAIKSCVSVFTLILLVLDAPSAFAQDEPASEPPDFYDPVEQTLLGWTLKIDPKLLQETELADRSIAALANHLQRISYILPADKVKELQALPIWIELQNSKLKNMQYHPEKKWLADHGHDPRLVKHVHIPIAKHLTDRHMWAKHPYVVLHELAHAYHDQVLSFEKEEIIAAYNDAKEAGIYEEILLYTGKKVRHYGMTNHKEYFAESTEAYLGVNDFYPFVRAELQEHDPQMYELMRSIWGPVE